MSDEMNRRGFLRALVAIMAVGPVAGAFPGTLGAGSKSKQDRPLITGDVHGEPGFLAVYVQGTPMYVPFWRTP